MATASAKITPLPKPTDTVVASKKRNTRKAPVVSTTRDAEAAQQRCNTLAREVQQLGAQPDIALITGLAEARAVAGFLVQRGLVSEAEMQTAVYRNVEAVLTVIKAQVAQQIEAQRAKDQRREVIETVRTPPLLVARR